MNGGTPEGFQSFNEDDVQILLTSYTATQARNNKIIAKTLARIFGAGDND